MPAPRRRLQDVLARTASILPSDPDQERFYRSLSDGDADALAQFEFDLSRWEEIAVDEFREYLKRCLAILGGDQPWADLSRTPSEFDAKLQALLTDIQTCMKIVHGIPTHRPPTGNEERDAELAKLKLHNPDWTFDAVAAEYNQHHPQANVLRQTAHRAYKDHIQGRRKHLAKLVELAQSAVATQPPSEPDEDGWVTLTSADEDPDTGIKNLLYLWRTTT